MGDASTPSLRDALPTVPWLTPESEHFKERRLIYCANNTGTPQAIVCPRTAEEVSSIVRLAREHDIPFSVRTGGHDVAGRSIVHDAVCIDMRDINSVQISEDRTTAVIGGGTQFGKLLTELHKDGLVTPHGSVPSIGYVGWASLGGYGCSITSFGLGVDQIVEAEVVNDKGDIVKADEEMMKGIRGAGGNFGIITSLRIKVYEMKTVLAGVFMIDTSKGISQVFKDIVLKIQDLESQSLIPREMVLQPLILNHPEAGRTFGMAYVWSSNDHYRGRKELETLIESLPAPVWMNSVTEMSPPDWLYMLDNFVAKSVWTGAQTISFGTLSPHILDIIGQGLEQMPSDPGTSFCVHFLSKQSPSVNNPALAQASCFNPEARQAHILLEILGSALTEDSLERCGQWAKSLREALFVRGEAMRCTYVSLVQSNDLTNLEAIYGEKIDLLRTLKQKYDPDGVFKYAVPRMLE